MRILFSALSTAIIGIAAPAWAVSTPLPVAFAPALSFPVGNQPRSVAIGDVNRDGKPDIVTGNYASNGVAVLSGRGDGTFKAATSYGPPYPSGVLISDVNLDGKPDIVAIATPYVYTLTGNGGGTFKPPVAVCGGDDNGASLSPSAGDINGDGKTDIGFQGTEYCLGDGRGGLINGSFVYLPGLISRDGTVADANHDGRADLFVRSLEQDPPYAEHLSVMLSKADGTFQRVDAPTFPTTGGYGPPVVADLNFDARPDIVIIAQSGTAIYSSLGRGDGTFLAFNSFPVGRLAVAIAVADVNRDGKMDVVVAEAGDNTVSVLLGHGDGTFEKRQTFSVGQYPDAVAVADVNQDGFPDLVVANYTSNTVSVLLGKAPTP